MTRLRGGVRAVLDDRECDLTLPPSVSLHTLLGDLNVYFELSIVCYYY